VRLTDPKAGGSLPSLLFRILRPANRAGASKKKKPNSSQEIMGLFFYGSLLMSTPSLIETPHTQKLCQ
jgi:hypothetical protein